MNPRDVAPLLLALALTAPATASAGAPSRIHSTAPSCFTMCPGGDLSTTIIVRRYPDDPFRAAVVLDFIDCPEILFCTLPEGYYPPTRTVRKLTADDGSVTFTLGISGVCTAGVGIFADGVQLVLPSARVTTTDPLGDFSVGSDDVAYVTTRVGTPDLTADLDGDGVVDAADVAFVTAHLGHTGLLPTPATPRSWGKVKILYR